MKFLPVLLAFSVFTATSFAADDQWISYEGKDGPGAEYVGMLSASERAALRDAVRAAYVDGEPDGARSYAALAWAVKGTAPKAA